MGIQLRSVEPNASIADFVQVFWMLANDGDEDIAATVLPDGIIDLFVLRTDEMPFAVELKGIDTEPSQVIVSPGTRIFAIGFKLLAVEYLLGVSVSSIVNIAQGASNELWGFEPGDLEDFDAFCGKATRAVLSGMKGEIDPRKKQLFDLIYASNGSMPVAGLAGKVYWSARQINRYFNQQFGIPLKAYCKILRFRASFDHIKNGKLFPEQDFFDQAHFIREVKKLAGVLPRELKENKNGRFLQFSALGRK
jgi:AraC-like DNA-binding protein